MNRISGNNAFVINFEKAVNIFKSEGISGIVKRVKNRLAFRRIIFDNRKDEIVPSSEKLQAFTSGNPSSGYYLSNDSEFRLYNNLPGTDAARWRETAHGQTSRLGLILRAGDKVVLPSRQIAKDFSLFISFSSASPQMSGDGLIVKVKFMEFKKSDEFPVEQTTILERHLNNSSGESDWIEATEDLSGLEGKEGSLIIECSPCSGSIQQSDSLAIFELVLSKSTDIALMRARAFRNIRIANEQSFFSEVYDHEIYSENSTPSSNACTLSRELLLKKIGASVPDFHARLQSKSVKKTLKVLSLCSGAARIEIGLARFISEPVIFTLYDINEKLLAQAKSRFPSNCEVKTVCGDVNQLSFSGECFDIIICVSGLHHIVELERVLSFISSSLPPDGEFWSIGEYIGRNGNRLYPEAYRVANEFFRKLPEKYRIHNYRGKQIDADLPNDDCSLKTFEGIRSQDIEVCLEPYLKPVDVLKFNCFLWRLFDLAYVDNYNTDSDEDRAIIESATELEYNHYSAGGQPTELFGIYCPR